VSSLMQPKTNATGHCQQQAPDLAALQKVLAETLAQLARAGVTTATA
jgi:hypothetical protein